MSMDLLRYNYALVQALKSLNICLNSYCCLVSEHKR